VKWRSWGAQAASLPFAAACREQLAALSPIDFAKFHDALFMQPASCPLRQAGSLRSPAPPLSC